MKSDAEREIDHLVILKPELADIMQLPIYCVSRLLLVISMCAVRCKETGRKVLGHNVLKEKLHCLHVFPTENTYMKLV
jgi:hypothetical protein